MRMECKNTYKARRKMSPLVKTHSLLLLKQQPHTLYITEGFKCHRHIVCSSGSKVYSAKELLILECMLYTIIS